MKTKDQLSARRAMRRTMTPEQKIALERKTMSHIVVPLTLKASADPAERTFEGFAATWDQDLGQDVIKRGAFKDTLKEWKKSGESLPLLDSHDQWSIMSALGQLIDAQETSKGLWTKWEVLEGPEGDAVLARLRPMKIAKRPIIGKMSIGFFPDEWTTEQPKGTTDPWDRIRNLTKVTLKEVSLVLFPMNPNASIDASTVKSFAISLENTDPDDMTTLTQKQLRRLNGIIGNLLKKQTDDDDEVDEEETPKTDPPAPSAKTDLEESGDDDDEDDDEELLDNLEDPPGAGDEEDEDADDDSDEDKDGKKDLPTDTGEGKKSEKEGEAATPIYQYPDALAQRIRRLTLEQTLVELDPNV